jgi:hypothetical protein
MHERCLYSMPHVALIVTLPLPLPLPPLPHPFPFYAGFGGQGALSVSPDADAEPTSPNLASGDAMAMAAGLETALPAQPVTGGDEALSGGGMIWGASVPDGQGAIDVGAVDWMHGSNSMDELEGGSSSAGGDVVDGMDGNGEH